LSTGTNLDGLAAFWGVERLILQAADDTITPAISEIKEADEAFRRRIQLSLEAHTSAGSRGAYIYWALSASGDIKDVSVDSPVTGQVLVSVLTNDGSGAASNAALTAVQSALNAEDVRPLTDQVIVQSAEIIPYQIQATLTLYQGPDASTVVVAAETALGAYIDEHHRLGHDINLSGIYAALHQPGVQNVAVTSPVANIAVASHQAAFCSADAIAIEIGGRDV
jgi:phage-related baseplate assembly protein